MAKNRNIKIKKSKLEKQYEELFQPAMPRTKIPPSLNQPNSPKELVTWVTYGAFEEPII